MFLIKKIITSRGYQNYWKIKLIKINVNQKNFFKFYKSDTFLKIFILKNPLL
jgi:hypothetical protein